MTLPNLQQQDESRLLSRFGRSFSAGELLFAAGDPGTEAYLLQDGRVRLIKRIGSAERNLRVLRPGDLFGESALVPGATRGYTAVAATAGTLLVIDQKTLEQLVSSHPAVALRVVQQLVRRLRDAEDQIEVLMHGDRRSKLVLALIKLAEQVHPPTLGAPAGVVEIAISPVELAARVGLDLDAVKTIVQELRTSGHVRIVGERVEIPNLGSLRELSELLNLRDQIQGMSSAPAAPYRQSND